MALLARIVADLDVLNNLLKGGLIGGNDLGKKAIFNLDGKTLKFTAPSVTVTFDTDPEGAQQGLTLKQIVAQINAASAGLASAYQGRLRLQRSSGVVTLSNGTANSILGFKDNQTGVVYAAPGGSAPALVSVDSMQNVGGGFLVVTNEA